MKIENAWNKYLTKALPDDDHTRAALEHAFWFGAVAAYNELSNSIRSGPRIGEHAMKDMEAELKRWHRDEHVAEVIASAMGVAPDLRDARADLEVLRRAVREAIKQKDIDHPPLLEAMDRAKHDGIR